MTMTCSLAASSWGWKSSLHHIRLNGSYNYFFDTRETKPKAIGEDELQVSDQLFL